MANRRLIGKKLPIIFWLNHGRRQSLLNQRKWKSKNVECCTTSRGIFSFYNAATISWKCYTAIIESHLLQVGKAKTRSCYDHSFLLSAYMYSCCNPCVNTSSADACGSARSRPDHPYRRRSLVPKPHAKLAGCQARRGCRKREQITI